MVTGLAYFVTVDGVVMNPAFQLPVLDVTSVQTAIDSVSSVMTTSYTLLVDDALILQLMRLDMAFMLHLTRPILQADSASVTANIITEYTTLLTGTHRIWFDLKMFLYSSITQHKNI